MPAPATVDDPRWSRILARDPAADGVFWYSVATTGVYCRPSCPSRAARPEHVAIHATLAAARATGFRPCRRCDPDGPSRGERDAALVARACRAIEAAEEAPPLALLARGAGLSLGHFHRRFRAVAGVTPKAYADEIKARRLREGLAEAPSVTAAIHDAGFGSAGRFYERSADILGMTPSRLRAGGAGETLRFATGGCSLGAILVASSAAGVAAIELGDDPDALVRSLRARFPAATLIAGDAGFQATVSAAIALVEAPGAGTDLPLDIRGTAFQRRVWQALAAVPAGATRSYAEIATAIGAPEAVRAVAGACAANALAVAIPCHRVVRSDGALSGYRWGVERKRALLAREAEGEGEGEGGGR